MHLGMSRSYKYCFINFRRNTGGQFGMSACGNMYGSY